jgi:hypothetical protein
MEGYNQYVEDELLTASGWEADGYQLFPISSFAVSSSGGWFQLPAESNLFFLKAEHWQSLGGWDELFRSPGGLPISICGRGHVRIRMAKSLCC